MSSLPWFSSSFSLGPQTSNFCIVSEEKIYAYIVTHSNVQIHWIGNSKYQKKAGRSNCFTKADGAPGEFSQNASSEVAASEFSRVFVRSTFVFKEYIVKNHVSDGLFELEFEILATTFSEKGLSKPMLWCICIKFLVFAEPFFCESTLSILMLSIVNYLHTFVLLSILMPSLSRAGWSSGDQNDDDATKKITAAVLLFRPPNYSDHFVIIT